MRRLLVVAALAGAGVVYWRRVQIAWETVKVGIKVLDDRSMVAYNVTIEGGMLQIHDMDRGMVHSCTFLNAPGAHVGVDSQSPASTA